MILQVLADARQGMAHFNPRLCEFSWITNAGQHQQLR